MMDAASGVPLCQHFITPAPPQQSGSQRSLLPPPDYGGRPVHPRLNEPVGKPQAGCKQSDGGGDPAHQPPPPTPLRSWGRECRPVCRTRAGRFRGQGKTSQVCQACEVSALQRRDERVIQLGDVLHDHTLDEDPPPAHPAQEDALYRVIEEVDITPRRGRVAIAP